MIVGYQLNLFFDQTINVLCLIEANRNFKRSLMQRRPSISSALKIIRHQEKTSSNEQESSIEQIDLPDSQIQTADSSNPNTSKWIPMQSEGENNRPSTESNCGQFRRSQNTKSIQSSKQQKKAFSKTETIIENESIEKNILQSQKKSSSPSRQPQKKDDYHQISKRRPASKTQGSNSKQHKVGLQKAKQTKSTKDTDGRQKIINCSQQKQQQVLRGINQAQSSTKRKVSKSQPLKLDFYWSLVFDVIGKSKLSLHMTQTYSSLNLTKPSLKLALMQQFCQHSKSIYSDVQNSLLKPYPNNKKNGLSSQQTVVKEIDEYCKKMQSILSEENQKDCLFSEKHAIFAIRSLIEQSFYYKYLAYNFKSIQFEHFLQRFHTFAFTLYQTYNAIKYFHQRQKPDVRLQDGYFYRGFIMGEEQFQNIQKGSIIQIPSAFSASSDIKVALGYSDLRNLYRKPEKKYILQIKVKSNLEIPSKYQCLNHGFMKVEGEQFDANINQNEYIFNHLNIFKIVGTSIKGEIHYIELQYGAIFQILNKESQSRTQQQKDVIATVLYHLSQAEGYDLGSLFSEFVTNQQFNSFFRQIERKQSKNVKELLEKRNQHILQHLKNGQIQCAEKLIEDNKRLVTAVTKNEALKLEEKAQKCTFSKQVDLQGGIGYYNKQIATLSKKFKLGKESYSKAYQSELWLQKIKAYLDKIQSMLLTRRQKQVKSAKKVIDLVNGEIIQFSLWKNKQKHDHSIDKNTNQSVGCSPFAIFSKSISRQNSLFQNSVIETVERGWKQFHVQYQRSLYLKVKVELFFGNKKRAEVYKREFLQYYLSKRKISCTVEDERSPQINRLIQCFKISFLSLFDQETDNQAETEIKFVKENIECLKQKIKKTTGIQKMKLCIEAVSNTKALANIQKKKILSVMKPKQIQKCRNWIQNSRSSNDQQWKKMLDAEKKEHQILQKSYNETRSLMEEAVGHLQFLGGQKERNEASEMTNEIAVLDLEMQEYDRCLQSMKYFEKQWCIGSKHQAINYYTAALSYFQTGQFVRALILLRRAKSIYEQCFILPQNKEATLKILRSQSEYQQICVKKTQILSLISLQKFNQKQSIKDQMIEMKEDLLGLKQCQRVNQSKFQGASRLNAQILKLEAVIYQLAGDIQKSDQTYKKAILQKNRQIGTLTIESSKLKFEYIRHLYPIKHFKNYSSYLNQIKKTIENYQLSQGLQSVCHFYYYEMAKFHESRNKQLQRFKETKEQLYLCQIQKKKQEPEVAESQILQLYRNCIQCFQIRHSKQQIQYLEARRRQAMFKLELNEASGHEQWRRSVRKKKQEGQKELKELEELLSNYLSREQAMSIDNDFEQSQMNQEQVNLKNWIIKKVRQKLKQLYLRSSKEKLSQIHPN